MKSDFYMTAGNDQLSGWTEKRLQSNSKAKLAPKIDPGHCLVVCCRSHPVQLFESQWSHYIWEVCSANRWDAPKTATPAPGIGQQRRPSSPRQHLVTRQATSASHVASHAVFTWPLANQLPLLQVSWQPFAGKTLPQPAGGRKCFSRAYRIPKYKFLCYRNKHFLLAKNVLIVIIPILIIKGVFEPSYNDLKFTVWNNNYSCTNLILFVLQVKRFIF